VNRETLLGRRGRWKKLEAQRSQTLRVRFMRHGEKGAPGEGESRGEVQRLFERWETKNKKTSKGDRNQGGSWKKEEGRLRKKIKGKEPVQKNQQGNQRRSERQRTQEEGGRKMEG